MNDNGNPSTCEWGLIPIISGEFMICLGYDFLGLWKYIKPILTLSWANGVSGSDIRPLAATTKRSSLTATHTPLTWPRSATQIWWSIQIHTGRRNIRTPGDRENWQSKRKSGLSWTSLYIALILTWVGQYIIAKRKQGRAIRGIHRLYLAALTKLERLSD